MGWLPSHLPYSPYQAVQTVRMANLKQCKEIVVAGLSHKQRALPFFSAHTGKSIMSGADTAQRARSWAKLPCP